MHLDPAWNGKAMTPFPRIEESKIHSKPRKALKANGNNCLQMREGSPALGNR